MFIAGERLNFEHTILNYSWCTPRSYSRNSKVEMSRGAPRIFSGGGATIFPCIVARRVRKINLT